MWRDVCVYCGSAGGRSERYAAAARELGRTLATRGIGLVYGGSSIGLMGIVADAALEAGGRVTGVIPHALMRQEIVHRGLADLRVVRSMHERKALMAELSGAFIALPGGLGTLDELFEIWTWAHLRFHDKPIGLLNVDGFFDHLLAHLDHATAEGFVTPALRARLVTDGAIDPLLKQLAGSH
ncbi:MAG: TIGR00730 family Rossman fold protein [Steroidobacteraceae bacterium]